MRTNEVDLKKLAEKINERWPNYAMRDVAWGIQSAVDRLRFNKNCDDADNGKWIIWCLDRLEELGLCVNLDSTYLRPHCNPEGKYWVLVEGKSSGEYGGQTRAEAVTLALAAALGEV